MSSKEMCERDYRRILEIVILLRRKIEAIIARLNGQLKEVLLGKNSLDMPKMPLTASSKASYAIMKEHAGKLSDVRKEPTICHSFS